MKDFFINDTAHRDSVADELANRWMPYFISVENDDGTFDVGRLDDDTVNVIAETLTLADAVRFIEETVRALPSDDPLLDRPKARLNTKGVSVVSMRQDHHYLIIGGAVDDGLWHALYLDDDNVAHILATEVSKTEAEKSACIDKELRG